MLKRIYNKMGMNIIKKNKNHVNKFLDKGFGAFLFSQKKILNFVLPTKKKFTY